MANENPPGFSDNTSIFSEKEARLSDDVVFNLPALRVAGLFPIGCRRASPNSRSN
jgi:hypothetical protein